MPEIRQTDDITRTESYLDNEYASFQYVSLANRFSSIHNSSESLNFSSSNNKDDHNTSYAFSASKMRRNDSDQKLPDNNQKFQYNFNRIGLTSQNQITPSKINDSQESFNLNNESGQLICNNFLTMMSNNLNEVNESNQKSSCKKLGLRSVPSQSMSYSYVSSNNSLVQVESNQEVTINTNLTMIQDANIDITYDHIKYINLFSILCCWCFPISGLVSIYFSRMAKQYFKKRDHEKTKKYLKRSEWMLIMTFLFGFTLLAIGFAFFKIYLMNDKFKQTYRLGFNGLPK